VTKVQRILGCVRNAVDTYNMIEDGDKIAVGVSGGKDSVLLLKALCGLKAFYPVDFEIVAITLDMRFNNVDGDFSEIQKICDEYNIRYEIRRTELFDIIFNVRKESNPCSLCAKLRRGMLNTKAIELGCNKLALGHSSDDVLHTFLLSLFYEGRLSTFLPKLYMDRTGMTVIRPLILTDEKDIKSASKDLPVTKSNCPADKHTKRELVKDLIKTIQKDIPIAKDRMFTALIHPERYNLFDKAYEEETYWKKKK
jgi:tRNA(Ile)-lysidine synthase TilS/MesJ